MDVEVVVVEVYVVQDGASGDCGFGGNGGDDGDVGDCGGGDSDGGGTFTA